MIALFTLLSVVAVSILVTRIATSALVHTGLSREVARLQARSAFTGTGFTTREAEAVVRHPVRRRILMALMLLQNAGLVTAISTLVLSFVDTGSTEAALTRGAILIAGLGVLLALARSRWVDRQLSRIIDWALDRYTDLEVTDYYALLNLQEEYRVSRVPAGEDSWLAERRLEELDLPEEGVLVLGIERADGSYVGAPRGRYTIHEGDVLVLYGTEESLDELNERLAGAEGEAAHERAKRDHLGRLRAQDRRQRRAARG